MFQYRLYPSKQQEQKLNAILALGLQGLGLSLEAPVFTPGE